MDRQLKLRELVRLELSRHEYLHNKLNKELSFIPKGTLVVDSNDNLYRYVRENNTQYKVRLTLNDQRLVLKLKKRRYIKKALKVLQKRINVYEAFLKNDVRYDPKTIEKELPRQYKGLRGMDIFLPGDINEEDWINAIYRTNPFPIKKPHYTPLDLCTRSKSEAMIATRLEERGEYFRYDAEVVLKHRSVYPDFTILDRKRRKIIYWEHLGKVGDEKYMLRNLKKLEEYADCGIVLGDNLFITYESENRPLSIADIDRKLDMILN